jgi:hypothetical protein
MVKQGVLKMDLKLLAEASAVFFSFITNWSSTFIGMKLAFLLKLDTCINRI